MRWFEASKRQLTKKAMRMKIVPIGREKYFLLYLEPKVEGWDKLKKIKEKLKPLGFSGGKDAATGEFFWKMPVERAKQLRPQIEAAGVSLAILDTPEASEPTKPTTPLPTPLDRPQEPQAPQMEPTEPTEPALSLEPSPSDEKVEQIVNPADVKGSVSSIGANMQSELRYITDPVEKQKKMSEWVSSTMKVLSTKVDEESQGKFVKEFLDFQTKFWKYSLNNTILIWLQTAGNASYVAGAKSWQEMGYIVPDPRPRKTWIQGQKGQRGYYKNESAEDADRRVRAQLSHLTKEQQDQAISNFRPLMILRPDPLKVYLTNSEVRQMMAENGWTQAQIDKNYPACGKGKGKGFTRQKFKYPNAGKKDLSDYYRESHGASGRVNFVAAETVDKASVIPDPKKTPEDPLKWRRDPNEENEGTNTLVTAGVNWAARNDIKVDLKRVMGGDTYGWAKIKGDKEIAIRQDAKGINQFSTLVHELSHILLHWKSDDVKFDPSDPAKVQQKELDSSVKEEDAETCAYVVLRYFGYETQDTTRYIAIWRTRGGESLDISQRNAARSACIKKIIEGIESELPKTTVPAAPAAPAEAGPVMAWLRRNLRFLRG